MREYKIHKQGTTSKKNLRCVLFCSLSLVSVFLLKTVFFLVFFCSCEFHFLRKKTLIQTASFSIFVEFELSVTTKPLTITHSIELNNGRSKSHRWTNFWWFQEPKNWNHQSPNRRYNFLFNLFEFWQKGFSFPCLIYKFWIFNSISYQGFWNLFIFVLKCLVLLLCCCRCWRFLPTMWSWLV